MVPSNQQPVKVSEEELASQLRRTASDLARALGAFERQGPMRNHVEAALGHVDAAVEAFDAQEKLPRARG